MLTNEQLAEIASDLRNAASKLEDAKDRMESTADTIDLWIAATPEPVKDALELRGITK